MEIHVYAQVCTHDTHTHYIQLYIIEPCTVWGIDVLCVYCVVHRCVEGRVTQGVPLCHYTLLCVRSLPYTKKPYYEVLESQLTRGLKREPQRVGPSSAT